ncbi:MAG: Hsp70 family protein [Pirellulaceae bacterium]|nr:Hsp70 family protein [Pirellulaceae bacterium]
MSNNNSPIIGIDLGTTNSVVAAVIDGRVQVIEENGEAILPSVVGLTVDGKLIVGQTAKNQLAAFPDRTIASVKRRMGQAVKLKLADQEFTPQELSAIILRRLRSRAEAKLGVEVTRAVITVPAFFDEDQRQATREAGQLAGLTVERIINEPTAASVVYHPTTSERRHVIVYDLGGGTFDVSIVRLEAGVVEVLSSKGDTQLGGDDFDQLLTKYVANAFLTEHNVDLMAQNTTRWRLLQACERAKCELSYASSVRISEEFIATVDGQPVNLDMEVTRDEYEDLISTLVERTIGCVDDAIRDSGLVTNQLDELILVGGSTRTPLVQNRLREEFQRDPQWSVNPDLAVALGAATQAAMQSGLSLGPVLIDVANHTLGLEVAEVHSFPPQLVFSPILRRNSPLPAKYEKVFYTMSSEQSEAELHVLQGESRQLDRNRSIGKFRLEGLNATDNADGKILVRFELTLDGILKVTAIERQSGITKTLKIDNALSQMGEAYVAESESRLQSMFADSEGFEEFEAETIDTEGIAIGSEASTNSIQRFDSPAPALSPIHQLVAKAKALRPSISSEDAADIDRLLGLIDQATEKGDQELIAGLQAELDDLLFYVA